MVEIALKRALIHVMTGAFKVALVWGFVGLLFALFYFAGRSKR